MVLEEIGSFAARELDSPTIQSDEALLRVEMTGVCRTDASFYQGKTRPHLIPLILGHEILGHIAEIGKEAARGYQVREGDRVVVESSIRCGRCPYCERGNYQLCDNHRSYGTSMTLSTPPHLWGAYGEYLYIAPGSVLHLISESVPAEAAVLACSVVADGIQWVRDMGQVQPGHTVLIQGAGQQGLAAAVAVRECGAEQIIVTGMSRDGRHLELARKLGASATIDVEKEDVQERINELTDTALADLVVDVSGSPQAPWLRRVPWCAREAPSWWPAWWERPLRSLSAPINSFSSRSPSSTSTPARRRPAAPPSSSSNPESTPFEQMVTHRFPLQQAEQAIQTVAGQNSEAYPIKVVLTQ